MASIETYGVGTSCSEGKVSGTKTSFSPGERIHAGHKWTGISGGSILTTSFQRKESGNWVEKVRHDSDPAQSDWTFQWQCSWIETTRKGDWQVQFIRNNSVMRSVGFKITDAAPPTPPPEPARIIGKVVSRATAFFPSAPIPFSKVTFSNKSDNCDTNGNYVIENFLGMSGPIIASAPGFETETKYITSPMEGTLTQNFILVSEIAPPEPEIPWYEKWFGWTLEDIKNLVFLNPINDIKALAVLLDNLLPEKWTEQKVQWPAWLDELGLWLFFGPAFATAVEGMIKTGATTAEANSITNAIKDKGFIKALDIMKANPLKYADDFRSLDPTLASQILKGMRKDQLAGLATHVFKASWDDGLRATAPAWKKVMFAAAKHKWTGAFGLISLAGTIMGLDIWGNWSIVDNLQFLSGKDADYLKASFLDGSMSKEDVLKELRQLLAIVKAGETKVKTSAGWNILQILFAPLWDDLVELTTAKIERIIQEVEEAEIPAGKGILAVTSNIEDSTVYIDGVWVGKTPYEEEMEAKTYHVLVTKSGYTSDEDDIEILKDITTGFPAHIELLENTANISVVSEPETGADVYIDDNLRPYKTNATYEGLSIGTHKIRIFKAPYQNIVYDVNPEEIELDLTEIGKTYSAKFNLTARELPPDTGNISVTSSPTGADIYINDVLQPFPTNSVIEDFPIGPIEVRIKKEGYEIPDSISETLEPGEVQAVDFGVLTPLPVEPGKLIIDVAPGDVDVFSAGALKFHIDETGHYEEELIPASYSYVFKKSGYYDQTKNFFITSGEDEPLGFALSEIPPNLGWLEITTDPAEVDISIAEGYLGTTDAEGKLLLELIPVYYMITFSKAGYESKVVTTYISKGATQTANVILSPEEIPTPYVPPAPYVTPTPYVYPADVTPNYSLLYPGTTTIEPRAIISAPTEKEMLLNIETTDLDPWEGRIFSIAYLDLTTSGAETQVFVDADEETLLKEFMAEFETINPAKLLGYNLKFDYQWIMNKLMLYRMTSKKFADVRMRDVYQLMAQCKEEFVFNASRKGTLDDYAKQLLGKGKYGSQETLLKEFISGNFQYVAAFQERQIELTNGLYQLFRFTASEGFITRSEPIPAETPALSNPETPETPEIQGEKTCPFCKAYNPITTTICEICGTAI